MIKYHLRNLLLHLFLFAFAFSLLTFYLACEKDYSAITVKKPPEQPKPEFTLSLAEAPYLTEIYLKLEAKNVAFPQTFSITRNGASILADTLTTNDTTVIDTGLTPSTSYAYRAYRLVDGQKTDSASLQAATMDTTSHEFSWETMTFGDGNASVLKDVFIINPNDIWAVGRIWISDSGSTPFNALHWDGQSWNLERIYFEYYYGTLYSDAESVYAFSYDDMIIASGGSIMRWDGQQWESLGHLFTSSNDTSLIKGALAKFYHRKISHNDIGIASEKGTYRRWIMIIKRIFV